MNAASGHFSLGLEVEGYGVSWGHEELSLKQANAREEMPSTWAPAKATLTCTSRPSTQP